MTHTLLRTARYLKDNRLTPSGFNKLVAPDDVRVVGEAALDADFNDGSDTVTYRIAVGGATGLRLTAELNYQAQSYGHLQGICSATRRFPRSRPSRPCSTAAR